MTLIEALQKHVKNISTYQGVGLGKEIDTFISENKNLSDTELLDKIYSVYGSRIKFLEVASHSKAIINIKEWVATFGFFFILGIVVWVVYLVLVMAK